MIADVIGQASDDITGAEMMKKAVVLTHNKTEIEHPQGVLKTQIDPGTETGKDASEQLGKTDRNKQKHDPIYLVHRFREFAWLVQYITQQIDQGAEDNRRCDLDGGRKQRKDEHDEQEPLLLLPLPDHPLQMLIHWYSP